MEQSGAELKRDRVDRQTICRAFCGHCVKLSAAMSQRPTEGGEDSMDKNKQRITMPARIEATHIRKPSSAI